MVRDYDVTSASGLLWFWCESVDPNIKGWYALWKVIIFAIYIDLPHPQLSLTTSWPWHWCTGLVDVSIALVTASDKDTAMETST